MGHAAHPVSRCDVLDELEAAVTLRHTIRVWLTDNSSRVGLPVDLVTHDGEDFLHLVNHRPIPVTNILRIQRD